MKPLIKYISLLIFSGLILPYNIAGRLTSPGNRITYAPDATVVKLKLTGYSVYKNLAEIMFPALKF